MREVTAKRLGGFLLLPVLSLLLVLFLSFFSRNVENEMSENVVKRNDFE